MYKKNLNIGAFLFVLTFCLPDLPAQEKIEPVYPVEEKTVIHVEAEDAVSTNFAKEPTLNYGVSGSRSLQLNRNIGLHGNAPFYADYVVYIQEEGDYEIWYGGSPAGPEDDTFPSYASPFTLKMDQADPIPVFRENLHVVENYSPAYYWNRLKKTVPLTPGTHTIRIEVTERRRYDGRYIFYLDSLFLLKSGSTARPANPLVKFPKDPANRSIDNPFLSVQDFEWLIKQKPDQIDNYIYLSHVYSLIGDYQNSLRILRRASALDPSDARVLLLIVKNRLWKGEAMEGLSAYRQYLELLPEDLDIWQEAGKVAAWVGKYPESLAFYTQGLNLFPGNLALLVNMGITHLWQSASLMAEENFSAALKTALEEPARLKELANIFLVNGYPDRSIGVYEKGIEKFPGELELYLLLGDVLAGTGKTAEADRVYAVIQDKFIPSNRLSFYLELAEKKRNLKTVIIEGYRKELAKDPDNLALREIIVQTLFWNGLRKDAVTEFFDILANYAFRQIEEYDKENADLLEFIGRLHAYLSYFRGVPASAAALRAETTAALSRYSDAAGEARRFTERLQAALARGETLPVPETGDPREKLIAEEDTLAAAAAKIEEFLNRGERNSNLAGGEISRLAEFLEKQLEENERFSRLTKPMAWKWDRGFYTAELAEAVRRKNNLAGYALGRIRQIMGTGGEAEKLYSDAAETERLKAAGGYALWELSHWAGKESEPSPESSAYAPFVGAVEDLRKTLGNAHAGSSSFTDDTPNKARDLLTSLETYRAATELKRQETAKAVAEIMEILRRRLEMSFFDLQDKTLLLRYELGDYLLTDKRLPEATAQFLHVLRMDTSNLNALYKLGTVRQLYGDWFEAMEYYRRVYRLNPRFENAEGYHNDLARKHQDILNFETKFFSDNSRVHTTAEGSYAWSLSSVLRMETLFRTETLRMYKNNPWGDEASTHALNSMIFSLPFDFYSRGFTLRPTAGLSVSSSLYDNPGGYTGTGTPDPLWYLSTHGVSPEIGISGSYRLAGSLVSAGYLFARERDTFIPGRPAVMRHTGEASFNLPINFDAKYGLTSMNFRTFGTASLLSDGNIKGTAVQDGSMNFHVRDNPWTNLGLTGALVFEHSLESGKDEYYSPDGVLVAKAGPTASTWIGLKNGKTLGFVAQTLLGLYAEHLTTSADMKFYAEVLVRTELSLGSSAFFFSLFGSGTFPKQAAPEYWSMQVNIGYTHGISSLLAQ
jgi:tetratricopeptide (TPR) repeat protein